MLTQAQRERENQPSEKKKYNFQSLCVCEGVCVEWVFLQLQQRSCGIYKIIVCCQL